VNARLVEDALLEALRLICSGEYRQAADVHTQIISRIAALEADASEMANHLHWSVPKAHSDSNPAVTAAVARRRTK